MSAETSALLAEAAPLAPNLPLRFPLSSAQERCWFINALDPGTTVLNIALRWEIRGPIDRETVADAFATIVERHEVLRTRIVESDGAPMQQVEPPYRPAVADIDLSALPERRRDEEALRLGREEAHKPFDPARLPLIRVTLLRMGPDRAQLLLTLHQLVFDGWSIRLISREFGLAAQGPGARVGLPDLPLQYGDYAAWQAAYFASQHFDREIGFWTSRLRGARYFEVPGDRPRKTRPTANGEIIATVLPEALAAAMMQRTRDKGVTPFSFGCAVIAATLHRRTGSEDIAIATQVGGREDPDLEPLIGVFINNLVLRFDLSGQPTFDTVLTRANQTVQDALLHQAMPFHKLVEILKPARDPSRMPLISVNFTVLQDVMENARYGAIEIVGQPSLSAGSLYDLNFFLVHWSTGWRMALEYNTDLFDKATGDALLALWRQTFEEALATDGFMVRGPAILPVQPPTHPAFAEMDAERVLMAHEDVAEAVLVMVGGTPARHAFVTLRPDYEGSIASASAGLMAYLERTMPAADGPQSLEVRIALPRLANGAIDVSALAATLDPPPPAAESSNRPSAPDDATLQTLLGLWQELLGSTRLTLDSDFFEHGGHSLLSLRLLARVEHVFGRKMPVSTLFAAPTVRSFAQALTGLKAPAADWSLVPIQAGGTQTPLLVINNTVAYYNLARKLGPDRPVKAIQIFDPIAPRALGPRDFRDIVQDYVGLIRQAQPQGPYVLMGLCVAGVIAYEAAQQLRDAGEDVPLVIMADSWRPGYLAELSRVRGALFRLAYRSHIAKHHWRQMRRGATTLAAVLHSYPSIRRSGLLTLASKLRLMSRGPLGREDWSNRWFLPHLEAARDHYRPGGTPGRVVLLRSDEVVTSFVGTRMGWDPGMVEALTTQRVPGWHVDMFQNEGALRIRDTLLPLLEAVDRAAGSPSPDR
ncbi:condensation domain-containing protein [Lichenihabitans sp. Uapishka_5]|uniref:condensation domain-containing protein n=1 Tax=Lichenihabitans sp. Uapishka_5 TaxID=3037302 RepID=UPI0029E7F10B|nr:condensation domain-containing protein [Lichenihabitans sp. Uapishka_5]MDX7950259.1 condensation domain-containing protein [Lichenihabitans sp. Uapishka_5]